MHLLRGCDLCFLVFLKFRLFPQLGKVKNLEKEGCQVAALAFRGFHMIQVVCSTRHARNVGKREGEAKKRLALHLTRKASVVGFDSAFGAKDVEYSQAFEFI